MDATVGCPVIEPGGHFSAVGQGVGGSPIGQGVGASVMHEGEEVGGFTVVVVGTESEGVVGACV